MIFQQFDPGRPSSGLIARTIHRIFLAKIISNPIQESILTAPAAWAGIGIILDPDLLKIFHDY